MRIGIDARFLTHPQKGGFKTYTENLITALASVDNTNEYILYIDRSPDNSTLPNTPNFKYKIVAGNMAFFGMPFREQISLPLLTLYDNLDLLHSLCLTAPLQLNCPLVVTIHDVIWLQHKKRKTWKLHQYFIDNYYRIISPFAAKNASAIITVSEYSKKSIIDQLEINPEKLFVTYEAAGSNYHKIIDSRLIKEKLLKHNINSEYILAIASSDPRKNIISLFQAYELLSEKLRENYHLVIICSDLILKQMLSQQSYSGSNLGRIHTLHHISNGDLLYLFNGASVFVFPSTNEGFGLPPLEAMSCGIPCIAANNSSIPEIVGGAALLVNPYDIEELAGLIANVLNDENLKNELSQKGLRRARDFSWERCAIETINVYQQVLENINITR